MNIYKKLVLIKLKKKKYQELIDETLRLLEKARIEYNLSIDLLNKRKKSVQKYYIAYIKIFQQIKEKKIIRRKTVTYLGNLEKNEKHKRESSIDIFKNKNEEKIRNYKEYLSIMDDINDEIKNYNVKFDLIQKDLNDVLAKSREKIEKLNKDSNELKAIYKELNQKQSNYYLDILKKGTDTRMEGLSWIVKRLLELNVPLDSTIFPSFLDQEQIEYIIQLSKYGYERNQLKILLDALREKHNELSEEKKKSNKDKKFEDNISLYSNNSLIPNNIKNKHLFNGEKFTNKKLEMKYKLTKSLSNDYSTSLNSLKSEKIKMVNEANIINIMLKNMKKKMKLNARDNNFDINDKIYYNNNIFKFTDSNDRQKDYLHDVFIIIKRIKELDYLIKESKKEEYIIFLNKFRFVDFKDETKKSLFDQVFKALFGKKDFIRTEINQVKEN